MSGFLFLDGHKSSDHLPLKVKFVKCHLRTPSLFDFDLDHDEAFPCYLNRWYSRPFCAKSPTVLPRVKYDHKVYNIHRKVHRSCMLFGLDEDECYWEHVTPKIYHAWILALMLQEFHWLARDFGWIDEWEGPNHLHMHVSYLQAGSINVGQISKPLGNFSTRFSLIY